MELFETYLPDLVELKNEPFYDRGILPTEAFAFISYCKKLNIECIIESGTAFGRGVCPDGIAGTGIVDFDDNIIIE